MSVAAAVAALSIIVAVLGSMHDLFDLHISADIGVKGRPSVSREFVFVVDSAEKMNFVWNVARQVAEGGIKHQDFNLKVVAQLVFRPHRPDWARLWKISEIKARIVRDGDGTGGHSNILGWSFPGVAPAIPNIDRYGAARIFGLCFLYARVVDEHVGAQFMFGGSPRVVQSRLGTTVSKDQIPDLNGRDRHQASSQQRQYASECRYGVCRRSLPEGFGWFLLGCAALGLCLGLAVGWGAVMWGNWSADRRYGKGT